MREIAHAPIITRELKSIHHIYQFFLIVYSYGAHLSDKFCLSIPRHPRALACASIAHDASIARLDRDARCLDARSPRLALTLSPSLARCLDARSSRLAPCLDASLAPCLNATRPSRHRASQS
jgi:hypothetical protein